MSESWSYERVWNNLNPDQTPRNLGPQCSDRSALIRRVCIHRVFIPVSVMVVNMVCGKRKKTQKNWLWIFLYHLLFLQTFYSPYFLF